MRRALLVVAVAAVLLVAGGAWYLRPIAPIATGYAAKTVCSGVFVAGRDVTAVAADLPDNPLVPFLRTRVDTAGQRVTTTLLGLAGSTAWHTPGLGCTLAEARPDFEVLDPLPAAGAAGWPGGDGPADDEHPYDVAALAAAIDPAFVEDDPDGRRRNTRAVVVIKGGVMIAERYGDGFGPDTPLLGWSMTKSVGSAIIGRLVHDGLLSVDDADLRPEWRQDARSGITIGQLMTMTDGLAFEEVYDPDTDVTRMLFRPSDMAAYAASKPLVADPGTRFAYSSGSTNILCAAAQDAAQAGPRLARDLIFEPLGMTSAVLEPDASGGLVCSSFMYATARDWARFGQWFLQDGVWEGTRLLPEGWVDWATTPAPVAMEGSTYGAGWWLNTAPDGTRRMPTVPADAFWASGHEGQQVVVVPSEDLVVVRLGFSGAFDGIDWGLEPLVSGVVDATREARGGP